jgi:sn-glycerol 3-phosphate transport system ATP-binding protein
MADVRLEGVTKTWGQAAAVENITFSAPAGHLVALLGPRLRQVDDAAADRRARYRGRRHDPNCRPRRNGAAAGQARRLDGVPELRAVSASLGRENILFGLKVRDVPKAERDARLSRAAGILGLEALLERKPSQLSGGQQQRVALGRAIVARPRSA